MRHFVILGKPIPQKQTRFARGRAYDPSAKDKKALQDYFIKAMDELDEKMYEGRVWVTLHFEFTPPKSLSRTEQNRRIYQPVPHIVKPDVDNLAYLVTNAMKGIVYKDDSQIVSMTISKAYSFEDKTLVIVHGEQ